MSAINGDKSRHQINRKRVVVHRAKIRAMMAARQAAPAAAAAPAKPAPRASGAKPR
jgi:hypothetical protein